MASHTLSMQLGCAPHGAQLAARHPSFRPHDPLHAARIRSHAEATCSYGYQSRSSRHSSRAGAQPRSSAVQQAQQSVDDVDDDIAALGLGGLGGMGVAAGTTSSEEEENPYSTMDALRWARPATAGRRTAQQPRGASPRGCGAPQRRPPPTAAACTGAGRAAAAHGRQPSCACCAPAPSTGPARSSLPPHPPGCPPHAPALTPPMHPHPTPQHALH
jgi:hypothetical protein